MSSSTAPARASAPSTSWRPRRRPKCCALHAKAEDEFDFILADELVRALSAAADNEQRYALTSAGRAALESAAV